MRVNHRLVKVFLRQSLKDVEGAWVTSTATAIAALDLILAGNYTKATDSDTTLIASTTAGKTFQFQVTPGLSRVQLMAHCEAAIEILERWDAANDARATPLTGATYITAIRKGELSHSNRSRPSFC